MMLDDLTWPQAFVVVAVMVFMLVLLFGFPMLTMTDGSCR